MKPFSLGRVAGVPLLVDWSAGFVIAFIVMTSSGPGGEGFVGGLIFALLIMGSILVHELGHAVAGRHFGLRPRAILLHGFGGLCQYERAPRGLVGVFVSAAGPVAGLALGGVALLLGWKVLAWVNLFWSVFNLLPMFPMDGGHIVRHAIEPRWGARRADKITRVLSLVTAALAGAWAWSENEKVILIIIVLVAFQNLPRR